MWCHDGIDDLVLLPSFTQILPEHGEQRAAETSIQVRHNHTQRLVFAAPSAPISRCPIRQRVHSRFVSTAMPHLRPEGGVHLLRRGRQPRRAARRPALSRSERLNE